MAGIFGFLEKLYRNLHASLTAASVEKYFQLALAAHSKGDWARALNNYQRTLESGLPLEKNKNIALCLLGIAVCHRNLSNQEMAFHHYQEAFKAFKAMDTSHTILSDIVYDMALVATAQGNLSQALALYQESLRRYRLQQNFHKVAICLLAVGGCHRYQGLFSEAVPFYEQALEVFLQINDQKGAAMAHFSLGNLYQSAHDYVLSLDHLHKSLQIHKLLEDHSSALTCSHLIAGIYWVYDDIQQAASYHLDSLRLAKQINSREHIESTLFSLAIIYQRLEDNKQALWFFRQALVIAEEDGHRIATVQCLCSIAEIKESLAEYEEASATYNRAMSLIESLASPQRFRDFLRVRCRLGLGSIYHSTRQLSKAVLEYQEAVEILENNNDKQGLSMCLALLGVVYIEEGNRGSGEEYLKKAIDRLEHFSEVITGSRQQKINIFRNMPSPYEHLIERVLIPKRDYGEVFEYTERSKARTLIRLLREEEHMVSRAVPSELFERYRRAQKRVRELEAWPEVAENREEKVAVARSIEHRSAIEEFNSIVDEVRLYDPEFSAMVRVECVRVDELKTALADSTALIELYEGKDIASAVCISSLNGVQGVELSNLTPSRIRALFGNWCEEYQKFRLTGENEEYWLHLMEDILEELYEGLFQPLRHLLPRDCNRLVFVPHRAFHLFPLHAMIKRSGSSKAFLIEQFEQISYAPSASIFALCEKRSRCDRPKRLLAVENPTGDLAFAEKEVQVISRMFPEHVVLGPSRQRPALKSDFLEEARRAEVVLVTGHSVSGVAEEAHIKLSGDEKLTLKEQFTKLELPECFLWDGDTCETAFHFPDIGDEWITLASGPLYAGAATVWSSLWIVDDLASSVIKPLAYSNLLKPHMTRARALNEAQRSVLRREGVAGEIEKISHPFFWGAFISSGAR